MDIQEPGNKFKGSRQLSPDFIILISASNTYSILARSHTPVLAFLLASAGPINLEMRWIPITKIRDLKTLTLVLRFSFKTIPINYQRKSIGYSDCSDVFCLSPSRHLNGNYRTTLLQNRIDSRSRNILFQRRSFKRDLTPDIILRPLSARSATTSHWHRHAICRNSQQGSTNSAS